MKKPSDAMPLSDAARAFARKRNVPGEFVTKDWDRVEAQIRERAFFMSGVEDSRILQAFRNEIASITNSESTGTESMERLRIFLEEEGYQPKPGDEDTIRDLRTLDRMSVAIDTNVKMARGFGQYQRLLASRQAFPAVRMVRNRIAEEPRMWSDRWALAYQETAATPGATPATGNQSEPGVALIGHPIWLALSRFGNPFPPFDWGSGMGLEAVSRREAEALGILTDEAEEEAEETPRPSMNEGLKASPGELDEDLREALTKRLGGLAEWDGDELVHTDPSGTTPSTPERLARIWRTLPAVLVPLQLEALRAFMAEGDMTEGEEATLMDLVARLGGFEVLADLWELVKEEDDA